MLESAAPGTKVGLPTFGVIVPIVTPLHPDRTPDLESLESLVDYVLGAGAVGVLALGSTGESVVLPAAHRRAVAERVAAYVGGRAHLMLGVATLGTADALTEAAAFADLGTGSLLVAAPAGLRVGPSELTAHFTALAAVGAPLVVYDVPSRVGIGLEVDLVRTLAEQGVAVGLKDSTGDLVKARRYVEATRGIAGFVRSTGCEESIDASLLAGYHAAVPGLANVFPEFHVALAAAADSADWARASAVQSAVVSLMDLYFLGVPGAGFLSGFFAAVKEALVQRRVIASNTRSAVFADADETLRRGVSEILDRAVGLAEGLGIPFTIAAR